MNDDTPRQFHTQGLGLFCHLYEYKTIAATAAAIHVDEKTVSRNLAAFEAEMGRKLFVRVGRAYESTSEADFIYHYHGKPTMDGLHEIRRQAKGRRRRLRVGASEFVFMYYLGPLLRLVSLKHPDVELQLITGSSVELEAALEANHVDIIVGGFHRPAAPHWIHAVSLEVVFLVSAKLKLADAEAVWRELAGHVRLVCPPVGEAACLYFERERARRGIRWRVGTSASSTAVASCLAALGDCVAVGLGASPLRNNPRIAVLPLAAPRAKIYIGSRPDADDLAREVVAKMEQAAREFAPPGSEFAPTPDEVAVHVTDPRIHVKLPPVPARTLAGTTARKGIMASPRTARRPGTARQFRGNSL